MQSFPALQKLKPYLRRYMKQTIASLVFMVFASASTGAFVYFIQKVLKPIIESGDPARLMKSSLEILAVGLVMTLTNYLQTYLSNYVGQRMITDLRLELFEHLQSLSLSYFENKKTGDLMSRMTSDLVMVQRVMTVITVNAMAAPLTVVVIVGQMFWWSWKLTLIACVGTPVVALAMSRLGRRAGVYARRVQEKIAELSDLLQERLTGIRIIQCFTREDFEIRRFREINQKSLREIMRGVRVQAGLASAVDLIGLASFIAVLCIGGSDTIHGRMSPTTLFTFLLALQVAGTKAKQMSNVVVTLQQMEAGVARLFQILETQPEIRDLPDAVTVDSLKGHIQFDHVSFAYTRANPVLHDISFEIRPGETVALVGPSGAGKSTIANLIPRLYDPTGGVIRVDGHDLRRIKLACLRGHIGIVPQEAFLFAGTVYENIVYGRPGASEAEVHAAARQANAALFISELPKGYETVIGERGATLSGGQRQRMAIARALLRDPRILILDEATSSLDAASEALVQDALEKLMQNRTTLIIAHRLSTIKNAHRILVIDRGAIVEQGTHLDLMQRSGLYNRLYDMQVNDTDGGNHGDTSRFGLPSVPQEVI